MSAVGYTSGDPSKVDRAGDTMTGDLVLDDASPAASEAYVAAHSGGGHYLEYNQPTPSANWAISHNFGVRPDVTVLDTSGTAVLVGYSHLDANTVNITFPAPFAGKAVLVA
jgi:hypothetical protein